MLSLLLCRLALRSARPPNDCSGWPEIKSKIRLIRTGYHPAVECRCSLNNQTIGLEAEMAFPESDPISFHYLKTAKYAASSFRFVSS
jgi:hypothetical protein